MVCISSYFRSFIPQDGLYGNLKSDEEAVCPVTVPAVLLVMSSLGTVAFFALGPGNMESSFSLNTDFLFICD